MYIAEQLKKKSVAEYLLYMWQVEDTLRAYGLDVEKMAREYIPQFGLDAEKSETLNLSQMSPSPLVHGTPEASGMNPRS